MTGNGVSRLSQDGHIELLLSKFSMGGHGLSHSQYTFGFVVALRDSFGDGGSSFGVAGFRH